MISLLLHESEAKSRLRSANNKDVMQMYRYIISLLPTNQCFFCEQQAMASGYVHLRIKASFVINNLFL